jgi:uncharacterized damage-inducible protein DinB
VDYNAWATARMFQACAALTEEELTRDLRSSFGSVKNTVLHVLSAEWFWLERWKNRSASVLTDAYQEGLIPASLFEQFARRPPDPQLKVKQYPDLASLRQLWNETSEKFRKYIEPLSTEELQRELRYTTTEGNPNAQPFWVTLVHIVNHSTHYRGQITMLLRQLGKPAIATDLIAYYRETDGSSAITPLNAELLRLLYEYNAWANHRLLSSCESLNDEQFTRDLRSSFPSVRDTLAHIMGAEWVWLERWNGRLPATLPSATNYPTLADIRREWAQLEARLHGFVCNCTPADLARVHEFRTIKGTVYPNPLWQPMQHVSNHSAYHRGQVAAMLRQLGVKPNFTDLIYFYREQTGQALD